MCQCYVQVQARKNKVGLAFKVARVAIDDGTKENRTAAKSAASGPIQQPPNLDSYIHIYIYISSHDLCSCQKCWFGSYFRCINVDIICIGGLQKHTMPIFISVTGPSQYQLKSLRFKP